MHIKRSWRLDYYKWLSDFAKATAGWLMLLVCVLPCIHLHAEDTGLCTTSTIDAFIQSSYGDDDDVKELWSELQESRIVRDKDSDENVRPQMVKMQSVVEYALASLSKSKHIKYAKAVIYTSKPAAALRATDYNLEVLVDKDFFEDKNRLSSLAARMVSVKEYLSHGGRLYSIHKMVKEGERRKKHKVPELNIYTNNLVYYRDMLVDKPVEKLESRYIGASYIAECMDGRRVFFAIKGAEEHDTKPRQWAVYYGDLNDKKLRKYYTKLQDLYKKTAEVPFDFDMNN